MVDPITAASMLGAATGAGATGTAAGTAGTAATAGAVDTAATTAMANASSQIPTAGSGNMYSSPFSQDTLNIQNQLIEDGYGDYLGDTGADGILGPKTKKAMELRDQAKNNNQGPNKQQPAQMAVTTPSYGNPFNRFG